MDKLKNLKSILLIDDSQDVLLVLKTSLEIEGYQVTTAETGAEALETLRNQPKPHLIVLDMNLEDMSGHEFLAQLEQTNPKVFAEVPVVIHSGMTDISNTKAAGFIRKPTDRHEFIKAIDRFVSMGDHPPYKIEKQP